MFRKILVTAAVATVAFMATQPATAELRSNGPVLQGIALNGTYLNGTYLNGTYLNGPVLNGVAADTQAFKVIAIELAPEVAAAE